MRWRVALVLVVLVFTLLSYAFESAVWGKGYAVPKRNDWILRLPSHERSIWECILWSESRSTLTDLNLGDNNEWGSSGVFQMEQSTFAAHQLAVRLPLSVHVWQASPVQQFAVARAVWLADGFSPWSADSSCF